MLPFLVLLLSATVSAFVVAALYQYYFASVATGSHIYRAFPLLGLTVTGLFVTVQFSLPLSLGLLGALSFVRFRNPMKEPEEVGALMIVIAVSIAAATFKLELLGILLAITTVTLAVQTAVAPRVWRAPVDGVIVVALPSTTWAAEAPALRRILDTHLRAAPLESLIADRDHVVLSYGFRQAGPQAVEDLRRTLSAVTRAATVDVRLERQDGP